MLWRSFGLPNSWVCPTGSYNIDLYSSSDGKLTKINFISMEFWHEDINFISG